jgi:hypothetical protein
MQEKQRIRVKGQTKKILARSGYIGISYDAAVSKLLDLKESIESQLADAQERQEPDKNL